MKSFKEFVKSKANGLKKALLMLGMITSLATNAIAQEVKTDNVSLKNTTITRENMDQFVSEPVMESFKELESAVKDLKDTINYYYKEIAKLDKVELGIEHKAADQFMKQVEDYYLSKLQFNLEWELEHCLTNPEYKIKKDLKDWDYGDAYRCFGDQAEDIRKWAIREIKDLGNEYLRVLDPNNTREKERKVSSKL